MKRLLAIFLASALALFAQASTTPALVGQTVTMVATVNGAPTQWQYYKEDAAGVPQYIPGASSATYQFKATLASAGNYSVRISNAQGSVTSSTVTLTVTQFVPPLTNPAITTTVTGTPTP